MANRFITGEKVKLTWQPVGGQATVLNIKTLSLDEDGVVADVSHTGTNSRTARICGKGDHKGTVNADYDLDQKPYNPPISIRFGSAGVILMGFDPNFPIQIPCRVLKTHYESAIENEVKYSFDIAEDVFSGVLVYPAS